MFPQTLIFLRLVVTSISLRILVALIIQFTVKHLEIHSDPPPRMASRRSLIFSEEVHSLERGNSLSS